MFEQEYAPRVDGQPVESTGDSVAIKNPADGTEIAALRTSDERTVDTAVRAASDAAVEWRAMDPSERGKRLVELAAALEERRNELAALETAEAGKPLHESRFDVGAAADFFRYFGGMADKIEGSQVPVPGEQLNITIREPLGVTGHIIPWNSPLLLAARSFAPALACGNSVVALPDAKTPVTTLELARIAEDSGVPAGVINVLTGEGEVGRMITEHGGIDSITFTGSVSTGKRVLEACARSVTPSVVELGSKSPVIVMPDADLEAAVDSIVTAGYLNCGQQCFAASRLLVHESCHGEVTDRLVEEVEKLVIGPGTEKDVTTGPLISPEQVKRVEEYVAIGRDEGARLRTGGSRPEDSTLPDGNFFLPTVFDDVEPDARIAQEEIFGPIVSVIEFADYEELIEIANGTRYGLTAGIWTDSVHTAHRAIRDLEAGVVSVNAYPATYAQTPFGGYKDSGIGREKGRQSIDHYTQVKNATIDMS